MVTLRVSVLDRRQFKKLPNLVNFYDTAIKKADFYGKWKGQGLVTWIDTTTFRLDLPPFTVIDVGEISNGLLLGGKEPGILLLMTRHHEVDTLMTGDPAVLRRTFQWTPYNYFKTSKVYYDVRYDGKGDA
jgi:hypothetical protein